MHLCNKGLKNSQGCDKFTKHTRKFENIGRKTIPVVVAAEEATLVFLEALGAVLRAWVDIGQVPYQVAWVVWGAWACLAFLGDALPGAYFHPS